MKAGTNAGDPTGVIEGHLKIVSLPEVELAKKGAPEKDTASNYADYPLVIRDGQKTIARITPAATGAYRAELPPGNYTLDVDKRVAKHARAAAQRFVVLPGQTVRIDLDVDAGVR